MLVVHSVRHWFRINSSTSDAACNHQAHSMPPDIQWDETCCRVNAATKVDGSMLLSRLPEGVRVIRCLGGVGARSGHMRC